MAYRRRIDALLAQHPENTDWNRILQDHLRQIAFFQHERLIHLIVTALFAQLIQLTVLTAALLVLLIPYIFHYYLLENEVQKMYAQYDEIWENCNIILQEKCLGKSSKK